MDYVLYGLSGDDQRAWCQDLVGICFHHRDNESLLGGQIEYNSVHRYPVEPTIPLGYPRGSFGPAARRPATEVTSYNRYGNRGGLLTSVSRTIRTHATRCCACDHRRKPSEVDEVFRP
jgi:hypothetical protein